MELKAKAFSEALAGFELLINHDLSALEGLDQVLLDGLANGKAQKFEYTLELCWKAIKAYLQQVEGIEAASPKQVVKAYFLSGHLGEDDYLLLIQAVDDRNRLSHIYDSETFDRIILRLGTYADLMRRVLVLLSQMKEAS